jgi:serine protease Do
MKNNIFLFSIIVASQLFNISNSCASEMQVVDNSQNNQAYVAAVDKKFNINDGFVDLVAPVMDAVVNIYTTKYVKPQQQQRFKFNDFSDFEDIFEQFGIPFAPQDHSYSNPKAVSLGSGFIIAADGYIVTNHHVVAKADEINVKLSNEKEYTAKLIGSDVKTDLALLKIDTSDTLPFVTFGDAKKLRAGDWIVAVGNPFGLGGSVTAGIVSSISRDIDIDNRSIIDDFIQIDASINVGNSGGPTFNTNGEVIGVNTAIYSPSGGSVGVGFAIPSNTAKDVIERLKKDGKILRGILNIKVQDVTNEIVEAMGLEQNYGALVAEVEKGGDGYASGLKPGDIIIEFNSRKVATARKLQVLVADAPLNVKVPMLVIRNKKTITLSATIKGVSDTSEVTASLGGKDAKDLSYFGIVVDNIERNLRQQFHLDAQTEGVIVTGVAKDSPWLHLIKVGDVIVSVNQQNVSNVQELNKIYLEAKKRERQNIVFFIERGQSNVFISVPLKY